MFFVCIKDKIELKQFRGKKKSNKFCFMAMKFARLDVHIDHPLNVFFMPCFIEN
jgi:hypothetical protein